MNNEQAQKQDRHALQAKGEHPAPCARFCEANAFQIEIRGLKARLEQAQKPEGYQEPVAYDKTELNRFAQDIYDQKMREGKHGHYESMFHVIHQCIKRVAPPQRQPLMDEQIFEVHKRVDSMQYLTFARAIEAAHGIKGEA